MITMRKELLKYINCPVCRNSSFDLEAAQDNGGDIEIGRVVCLKCQSSFKISKGIIYLYEKMSATATREKASHEREIFRDKKILDFQDDNWILKYPHVPRMGIDPRSERTGRLISENTELSLKRFITKNNSTILEIGAGKGWVMSELAGNNYCVALDILTIKPIGLEAGEIYIKHKKIFFERVAADMVELPFKDQIFDYVIISSSLHHSPDLDETLSEIKRVLKFDGQFILLNEPYQGILGGRERTRVNEDRASGLNEKRYTISDWNKYFFQNGFQPKIFLPENLAGILKLRGRVAKKIAWLLSRPLFSNIFARLFKSIILRVWDGYFNASLRKSREKYR